MLSSGFRGKFLTYLRRSDPTTRTMQARIEASIPASSMKKEMYVTAGSTRGHSETRCWFRIPRSCATIRIMPYVYVQTGDNSLRGVR